MWCRSLDQKAIKVTTFTAWCKTINRFQTNIMAHREWPNPSLRLPCSLSLNKPIFTCVNLCYFLHKFLYLLSNGKPGVKLVITVQAVGDRSRHFHSQVILICYGIKSVTTIHIFTGSNSIGYPVEGISAIFFFFSLRLTQSVSDSYYPIKN